MYRIKKNFFFSKMLNINVELLYVKLYNYQKNPMWTNPRLNNANHLVRDSTMT